jgi:protocatechuate 3,4-dioxygenase beta subunit
MHWKLIAAFVILCCVLNDGQEKATDVHETKSGAVSGTVTRADTHLPLKNVQVTIVNGRAPALEELDSTSFRASSVKTNDKGNFEFANLPPGSYYIRATHAGMIQKSTHPSGILVNLEAGQSQDLSLLMLIGCAITGRILNEEGEPMENVSVATLRHLYTMAGRRLTPESTATTDDKGEYRLFGLKPGSYLLLADTARQSLEEGSLSAPVGTRGGAGSAKENQKVYAATYYQNESAPEHATPIVLKPGDETQANFALVRVPAHHISGKISGLAMPKPADKAEEHRRFVTVMRNGSSLPTGMAVVSKDSSFETGPLPSGKYKVMAMDVGTMDEKSDRASYGFREVVVGDSDVTGVTITLNSARKQLNGVVHTDGNSKLDYSKLFVLLISAEQADEQSESADVAEGFEYGSGSGFAEVGKDGSFKVDVSTSSDTYHAGLGARGSGLEDWFTSKVLVGGKDVLESGFKITGAEHGPIEIVISDKGATLEGVALNGEKKPFPNAEVIAVPSDPKLRKRFELMQRTVADQQGHFKLRGIRPGEYIAFALEEAQEQPFLEDSFLKQNSGQTQALKLEPGGKQKVELQVIVAETQ